MIVKVCGMADAEIMHQLAKLKPDMLGFIFYPRSPRFVEGKIDPAELRKLPSSILKTGVFVNANLNDILEKASIYQLQAIQLHGSESIELCQSLHEKGFVVLKAFNLNKKNDYEAYAPYCNYFLFDTPSEQHGGTGEKFDWSLLESYKCEIPFLLSGGIGPNDAEEVLQINHPMMAGIDINSKFEMAPGIKDFGKIESFLNKIN